MAAVATSPASRLTCQFFSRMGSEELEGIRNRVDVVLEDRSRQLTLFAPPPTLPVAQPMALVPAPAVPRAPAADLAQVLSPTQVRTFLGCSARWWFKYGLSLPEPKTSALALGCAVHRTVEANFRQKIETKQDLGTLGVVALFREAWQDQAAQTEFRDEEDPGEIGKVGEQLVTKYMEEAAPSIEPAAVEVDVTGVIGGVAVRGKVDLLDSDGRIIDIKTAARKPSGISPDYAFQLATYRQITPGASGEARLDTLVKTKTVQLIPQAYTVSNQDLRATEVLYPLVQEGIRRSLYIPNRQSLTCSRRNCAFWRHCEREFGGTVEIS
jgi:putative RecB family exonuclease